MSELTVEIAHEGNPQWIMIVAFGMRSHHTPATALVHCTISSNKETEIYSKYGCWSWELAEYVIHFPPIRPRCTWYFINSILKWHLAGLLKELLTCIQCHRISFLSYAFSGCWQGGRYTPSGLCTLGGQCGEWPLSGQRPSELSPFEGQPLPTAPSKQRSLKSNLEMIRSVFKTKSWLISEFKTCFWCQPCKAVGCRTFLVHSCAHRCLRSRWMTSSRLCSSIINDPVSAGVVMGSTPSPFFVVSCGYTWL